MRSAPPLPGDGRGPGDRGCGAEVSEAEQFHRLRIVARMDKDLVTIQNYRENEKFFIHRLIDDARSLGTLDERLRHDQ
jgi:hypothetical protein